MLLKVMISFSPTLSWSTFWKGNKAFLLIYDFDSWGFFPTYVEFTTIIHQTKTTIRKTTFTPKYNSSHSYFSFQFLITNATMVNIAVQLHNWKGLHAIKYRHVSTMKGLQLDIKTKYE